GLRISTRAPPASEFGISISGVGEIRKLTLPIVAPRRDLGSAVDRSGQLELTFRRPLHSPPPKELAVEITAQAAGNAQRCFTPAVEIRAVRFGRWHVPGAGPFIARARKGDLWSPALAVE
ncbi:MAG TPA: hypothetical protein VND93_06545, partial [Myxococcales bacterium]|nr:hypothetical protein [Myxococcales bacterium]